MEYKRGRIIRSSEVKDEICIEEKQLASLREIQVFQRCYGSFMGKAYALDDSVDWIIVTDEQGILCLVPLLKKKDYC